MVYDIKFISEAETLPRPQPIAICAREALPKRTRGSIFLAGPTPRDPSVDSWRPQAMQLLWDLGYDGHVFIPEDRNGKVEMDYTDQVEWETEALNRADVIVFWVPRNLKTMPAFTTNIEWGKWADSGKAVLGAPDDAPKMKYLYEDAKTLKVPVFHDLKSTLAEAVKMIGEGALRVDGEAQVPLHVWKHPSFQGWYEAQRRAGNRLDKARVLWTFRVGPERKKVFAWAVHVDVYVANEQRNKANEFVFGRVDVAAIVLYHKDTMHMDRETEVQVVLVREFRSPARTGTGNIIELPSGSIDKKSPREAALKELEEETGFKLDPSRLQLVGTHQVAGTLSAHTAVVYSAAIESEELDEIIAHSDEVRGVEADGERTTVVVDVLSNLMDGSNYDVDWSTLGMISAAVLR